MSVCVCEGGGRGTGREGKREKRERKRSEGPEFESRLDPGIFFQDRHFFPLMPIY